MIIGRIREQKLLEKVYLSKEAEFVVVFGRRRVGKTYLIREFFKQKKCQFFHATGLQKGDIKKQLKKFSDTLSETFFDNIPIKTPENWDEALRILHQKISNSKRKIVIFLDELPWMATKKSGLLQEIDYFWNKYWSSDPNIIFIVCGSAASWLIKKIIYNRGGLHNRITCQIKLTPFNLYETETYLTNRKIKLNKEHITSLYMALGGIPYYLRYVAPGLTAEENIQAILFDKDAPLKNEFDILFDSLFDDVDSYLELLNLIGRKKEGILRSELKSLVKLSGTGGRLSKNLQDLRATGFIDEHTPWDRSNGEYYKLADEFTLFYLHWILPDKKKIFLKNHWITQSQKPAYYAWAGYAFEAICMKHISQIIHVLKIRAGSVIGSWRYVPRVQKEDGAQIDLIIDRNDNAMTICEIKYARQPFVIDKTYFSKLKQKIKIFKAKSYTKKQIFLAMICASGLKENIYSEEIVDGGVVTLSDLFLPEE